MSFIVMNNLDPLYVDNFYYRDIIVNIDPTCWSLNFTLRSQVIFL